MSKKCPKCNSEEVTQLYCFSPKDGWQYRCESCQLRCYPDAVHENKQTVFHRITASPEVLAEKLVFWMSLHHSDGSVEWVAVSTIAEGKWKTKAEAIAATVAKLNEVAE